MNFRLNRLFFIALFITSLNSYSQDCNQCESGDYVIDTSSVINQIRNRYQFLSSLTGAKFDYIFEQVLEDGCNEPNEIHNSVYYLNKEIGITSEVIKGSGEGGYYSNSLTKKYFQSNRLIFEFIVKSNYSINYPNDSFLEEFRIYYDNCGQIIRKLYKKASGKELSKDQTLEQLIISQPNKDITPIRIK